VYLNTHSLESATTEAQPGGGRLERARLSLESKRLKLWATMRLWSEIETTEPVLMASEGFVPSFSMRLGIDILDQKIHRKYSNDWRICLRF